MPEEIFDQIDTETLMKTAVSSLKETIKLYEDRQIDGVGLVRSAENIWTNVNRNTGAKALIEEEMKKRRMALNQMAALDIATHGDPVRKRYDPHEWLKHIPEDFKDNPNEFVLDRCKSLVNLLGG